MAGTGKEPCLAQVGRLRLGLRDLQGLLGLGALVNLLPQLAIQAVSSAVRSATRRSRPLLRLAELIGGDLEVGYIGIGRNETAARHRIAAHLQDGSVRQYLLSFFDASRRRICCHRDRERRYARLHRSRPARPGTAGNRRTKPPVAPASPAARSRSTKRSFQATSRNCLSNTRDALRQVVERRLQQHRFLGQFLLAAALLVQA